MDSLWGWFHDLETWQKIGLALGLSWLVLSWFEDDDR